MIEIRIHGRGGQGNVVAAYLLAAAAIKQGLYGQAFPAFGAERRGAPVQAFVRISPTPIRRRSQVREPAFLIIQDQALVHIPWVLDGLHEGGGILINSATDLDGLLQGIPLPSHVQAEQFEILGATALAQEYLGRPVPNTALLAAFLSMTGLLPVDALTSALEDRFQGRILQKNLDLVRAAAEAASSRDIPAQIWAKGAQQ